MNRCEEKFGFSDHLSDCWYKNKLSLRCIESNWDDFHFDCSKPPIPYGSFKLNERVWSIPSLISEKCIVVGCWDHRIHCVNLETLQEIWSYQTDGPVYSSPAVLGDGSFIIGCEDHCLRRISPDGKEIWKFQSKGAYHGTPTADEGRGVVYAGSYDRNMYAIDISEGALLWKRIFNKNGHPRDDGEDIYCSPALAPSGDIVFGTVCDLVCVTPSGETRWSISTEDSFFSSTPAIDYKSNIGIAGTSEDEEIYVFDVQNGDILQRIPTTGWVRSCPSMTHNNIAIIGDNAGFLYAVDLLSNGVKWKTGISSALRYAPITTLPSGQVIFPARDERLHCLDSESGELLWQLEMQNGAHSAPLVTPYGHLVVGSHRNMLYFYRWE